MKSLILLSCLTASVMAGPAGWVTETPLEFISPGKWSAGSTGQDIVVVDKATGLARVGQRVGPDFVWSEMPTGMQAMTGATTVRSMGGLDALVVSSEEWNAIQIVKPGSAIISLTPPLVGPKSLVRFSTGQLYGNVIEDMMAAGTLGNTVPGDTIGAIAQDGTPLFQSAVASLPLHAQSLTLSPQISQPVLVSVRDGKLRLDHLSRTIGIDAGGFDLTPASASWAWTASRSSIYAAETNDTIVHEYKLASSSMGSGKTKPSGIAATYNYELSGTIESLETVSFTDPAAPDQEVLLAVKFNADPSAYALYRLTPPSTVTLLSTLTAQLGETLNCLISIGSEFLALSGPNGRTQRWQRFAQPTPGAAPVHQAEGSLPSLRPNAASPNLFHFDLEPFVNESARLLSSSRVGDWTNLDGGATQETDAGFSLGLVNPQPIAVAGGFYLGNQVLPSASTAGLGPIGGVLRSSLAFTPSPGGYPVQAPSSSFVVNITGSNPTEEIYFRRTEDSSWQLYDVASPPALPGNTTLLAFTRNPATNALSPLQRGSYTFSVLPAPVPVISVDADGNGLSDAFERAFGVTDPNGDSDGDGINNLTEQNSGSDPLDALSPTPSNAPELKLEFAQAAANDGSIHLTWPAGLAGIILETSPNLNDWSPVVPQPVANSYSVSAAAGRFFYRLTRP